MSDGSGQSEMPAANPSATRSYLESRVREEAHAAAMAPSLKATMIHLALATAYAREFGANGRSSNDRGWVDQHRVW